jgi:hypothetical protein
MGASQTPRVGWETVEKTMVKSIRENQPRNHQMA